MLQLAQELGNVSKACRIVGYSRQHFYEIRRNFQVHGAEGLLDRLPGAKGPHPNRVAPPIEKAILAHALKHPTHGAQRVANELMLTGLQVSSGGVRGVWTRNKLQTRHHRLLRLEETVRKRRIKLTEEQIQALERFDPEFRERHIEVHATGELVAVDTLFAGTLKGVGKVYIETVLDCFSRHVWARLHISKMPVTAVQILNNHVLPFFEEHGVQIWTIPSDRGTSTAAGRTGTPTSSSCSWRTSSIAPRRWGDPSRTASSSGFTAPSSKSISGSRGGRLGTRPSRRCRRTWTPILRPTTSGDRTEAAAWRDGRPTRSSRPRSPESAPANPQPRRR